MPWLLLLYRLPAQPSAPRVAVWRALRRLDGALLQKGAYLAPAGAGTLAVLRSLAHDIRNFGGEASVLEVARADNEASFGRRFEAARKGARGRAARGGKRPARRRA